MGEWWMVQLDRLRWDWDGAYLISYFEPDTWLAQRRDNRETLTAGTPYGLLDLIRADYAARPVSRQVAPGDDRPPAPSCRFPLE